jgi:hypothetical protein
VNEWLLNDTSAQKGCHDFLDQQKISQTCQNQQHLECKQVKTSSVESRLKMKRVEVKRSRK